MWKVPVMMMVKHRKVGAISRHVEPPTQRARNSMSLGLASQPTRFTLVIASQSRKLLAIPTNRAQMSLKNIPQE